MQLCSAVLHQELILKATLLSEECYTYDPIRYQKNTIPFYNSSPCIGMMDVSTVHRNFVTVYLCRHQGRLTQQSALLLQCSGKQHYIHVICCIHSIWTYEPLAIILHQWKKYANSSLCRFANVSIIMKHDIFFSGTSQVSRFRIFVLVTIFVSLLNNFGAWFKPLIIFETNNRKTYNAKIDCDVNLW
jgi:hypothetical protein